MLGPQHPHAVELQSGDLARVRAGREDERAPHHLGAVLHRDLVASGVGHAPPAVDGGHTALLEEPFGPLGELLDDLLLARLRHGQVEARLPHGDAELARALHRPQHLRRLEQLLRRDASLVQAHAADAPLLDQGDLQAGGAAVEGSRVATRAAAQHHDVVLGHPRLLLIATNAPSIILAAAGGPPDVHRPSQVVHRAMRIWMADAARMATAQSAARRMSIRVLMAAPLWSGPRQGHAS
jgi:hypothetical protein